MRTGRPSIVVQDGDLVVNRDAMLDVFDPRHDPHSVGVKQGKAVSALTLDHEKLIPGPDQIAGVETAGAEQLGTGFFAVLEKMPVPNDAEHIYMAKRNLKFDGRLA